MLLSPISSINLWAIWLIIEMPSGVEMVSNSLRISERMATAVFVLFESDIMLPFSMVSLFQYEIKENRNQPATNMSTMTNNCRYVLLIFTRRVVYFRNAFGYKFVLSYRPLYRRYSQKTENNTSCLCRPVLLR